MIVEIAQQEGCEETSLPPLYSQINPRALRLFVDSAADERSVIRFTYCGYNVIVTGDGDISIDSSGLQPRTK
ncbi:HalOD1 output domain-containing protein [Natronoarchaeum mannanilyticum]|uniref:HalOD1 output domain-containing protein n=1 Tax=Natronoarchaeum mannanilyticum TaxID=926360 RepID=UPI003CD0BC43